MIVLEVMAVMLCVALYWLIGVLRFGADWGAVKSDFMRCCVGGGLVSLACVVVATALVERDESYWWYGPAARANWLFGVTGVASVAGLIAGPVYGARRAARRRRLDSDGQ